MEEKGYPQRLRLAGLDAGCGMGQHAQWLAEAVSPEGAVTGLDLSATNLDAARALAAASSVRNWAALLWQVRDQERRDEMWLRKGEDRMSTGSRTLHGQGLAARLLRARTVIAVYAVLIALCVAFLHPWMMPWGATADEQRLALPGDEATPESYYTRAITIDAPTSVVWQWIVQIGQDRAGFYSNTWLENLFGGDIHNAWEIRPEWQQIAVGDTVPMAPRGNALGDVTLLKIVALEPGRMIADLPGRWVLLPVDDHTTRVLLRELPQGPVMGEAFAYWVYDPMHFVMEQRMLQGIKERAEGQPFVPPILQAVAQISWIGAGVALLGFYLSRRRHWPWLALPLVVVADGLLLGHDPQAALAGFLAAGITVAGALAFGRKWWPAYAYLGAFVLLVLLFTPDAYTAFGLLFALTGVAAGALLYRSRRRATGFSGRMRAAA